MTATRGIRTTALGCAAAVMVLTGCSAGSDTGTAASQPLAAADQAPVQPGADSLTGSTLTGDAKSVAQTDVTIPNTYLVRTATIELTSRDLGASRADVSALLARVNGYVVDESSRADADGTLRRIHVVLAVPTDRYAEVLSDVNGLATVIAIDEGTEDVTGEVVDVDTRVASARIALTRIQKLLRRATALGEVIQLESVLSERQASLESLLAQQKSLADRTRMATITLDLRPTTAPAVTERVAKTSGFLAGLSSGWASFTGAFTAVSTAFGAMIPFLVLLGLLAAPVLAYARRQRRPAATAPPTQPSVS